MAEDAGTGAGSATGDESAGSGTETGSQSAKSGSESTEGTQGTAQGGAQGADKGSKAGDDTDWKAEARKHEARAKKNADAASELAKIKEANATDQEKAVNAAKAEVQTVANKRVVRAEVRAQAAGLFADPSDAPLYVDLDSIEVNDDGDPDTDAIGKALKAVLKAKPHLAKAADGKTGPGNPGFGPGGATPGSPEDYAARIAAAEKAGDVKESIGLKTASLFGSRPS